MGITTLRDRIENYQSINDFRLLPKLPVIIVINGNRFSKTTSLLRKPFDQSFIEMMRAITIKLAHSVDGACLVYSFNDEIIVVARNNQSFDTQPWCGNKIQKIASMTASIATFECSKISGMTGLNLFGDAIFTSKAFTVPNITEAINTLVLKQQQAIYSALQSVCYYELIKQNESDIVHQILNKRTVQEKISLLRDDFNIDFDKLPLQFSRGCLLYRRPAVLDTGEVRAKWHIDSELPLFSKEIDFLGEIFRSVA